MAYFRTTLLAGVIAATLAGTSANAAIITQTVTVGGGSASLTTDLQNAAFDTFLQQFNSADIAAANPGSVVTLNSIQLSLNTVLATSGTLQNQSATTQSFTFGLSLSSFINAIGNGAATAAQGIVLSNFGTGTAGEIEANFGNKRFNNVASGASVNYPNTNGTQANLATNASVTLTDAASLAAFSGTGDFGLGLNTMSFQSTSGGGGNVASNLNTRGGGTFVVSYDYSLNDAPVAVPEPASMALLGVGIAGLMMARRRQV